MPKAICRFDVESLNVGLKNELEIEEVVENDTSGTNVFCFLVGKVFDDNKVSFFKNDKALGNTDYLDLILAEENHVEAERYDDRGRHLFAIYVPYDIQELPCSKKTIDESPCGTGYLFELTFASDKLKKIIYIDTDELSSNLDNNIYSFIAGDLEDYLCDAAKAERFGLKYLDDSDDEETFDWYSEISAVFFDQAGYNVLVEFESVEDFCNHIASARIIKK